MTADRTEVLIAGAGPAGLLLRGISPPVCPSPSSSGGTPPCARR
jgi:hypothetical protein